MIGKLLGDTQVQTTTRYAHLAWDLRNVRCHESPCEQGVQVIGVFSYPTGFADFCTS